MHTFGLRRSSRASSTLVLLLCLLPLFFAREAHARRRGIPFLFIINTGDALYKVADLPPALASDPQLKGWVLGYKCSHFGILWADFATWDRQLVVFKGDTYSDLPPELVGSLQAQYPFSACERNPWNKYGCIVLVGGIGLSVYRKFQSP